MYKPIIGITERGDASIDFSWVEKLQQVDGAIIITKNLTHRFREQLLPYASKCILHASITGWGGTAIEPNIPVWHDSLARLENFVNMRSGLYYGFPRDHIVVRVDPIIPTNEGINLANDVIRTAYANGFQRFRVSVFDGYTHVKSRFAEKGIEYPYPTKQQASDIQMGAVNRMLHQVKNDIPDITIEACAERRLIGVRHCGCVSEYDLNILGIEFDDIDAAGYQRPGCMCYSGKRELLNGDRTQCPYQCLYCYWQDDITN